MTFEVLSEDGATRIGYLYFDLIRRDGKSYVPHCRTIAEVRVTIN